jgi:TPR repeat protein
MVRNATLFATAVFCAAAVASAGAAAQAAADARWAVATETLACSSYSDALPQLRSAAEAGSVEAQELLGWLYYEGARVEGGVQRDLAEARRWLRLAAEEGRARAQALYTALEMEGESATRFAVR